MKIRKLEIVGFKSFVDRTVVHFDQDVIGIVGPNGCGKSNIVDAIRWCMGEQSAKNLRGRGMVDVIFNGSDLRAAHDFAEVTLTFENDDPSTVPLAYRDYAEIAITRRLERSGDSDYLINKTAVRLKDVTDLFLGTGAGTRAYAIVEQGKIGLIVSAKPEDRRMLIEEAAGITKFKSRKKAAEQKIELTRQNLLRVGDIVSEIERNLGSLKRQAAKADRYMTYRKELEDLQLYEASHRYLELVGWVSWETGAVKAAEVEAAEARLNLEVRDAELEAIRQELLTKESRLEQAQTDNFVAENEVRAEEGAVARAKDRIASLRDRERTAAAEEASIAGETDKLAHEKDVLTRSAEAVAQEEEGYLEQVLTEEDRLRELADEQSAADQKVAEYQRTLSKMQAEIAAAEAKLSGFEGRQKEQSARLDRIRKERDDLEAASLDYGTKVRELTTLLEELQSSKTTTEEEKKQLESRLGDLRRAIVATEKALDEGKHELSRKRSRMHALLEVQSRLEGVGAGVRALVATRDGTIRGLSADRIDAPQEFTHALAGLLGARLQEVLVDDMDRGVKLLDKLSKERKGRATLLPLRPRYVAGAHRDVPTLPGVLGRLVDKLRYLPEDEPLVSLLIGDAIVVEHYEAAKALSQHVHHAPIVTLDGTVVYPDGRIAGGQGEELAAHMLESKRETRELSREVEELERLVAERLAAHQSGRTDLQTTQSLLDRARTESHSREIACLSAEKDLRQANVQLEATRKRLEALYAEQEDLAELLHEGQNQRDAVRRALEDARLGTSDVTVKLREAESVAASWREQTEARRQNVMDRKVRLASTRERMTSIKGTLQRISRSADELLARRKRLEEELHSGAVSLGETIAAQFKHQERLSDALDRAILAASALTSARAEHEAARASMQEREAKLRDLRQKADETRVALMKHELSLREKEMELTHLLEGVAEKFRGLRLPTIIGDYHLRPVPDETVRARIGDLVGLIERMGAVNLDAVRELAEAEKRYAYYSEHKTDLEKAVADLEKAIRELNIESRRLFAETFEAVDRKFQEIFPRMFRGGRASLRLTNPEDMLETGIDILAQPPGKKLSSIELMSGGEKALTAVSLIFAIFQIKPSPFCILDEVDAPLDEANVARYNELIRAMTDRSQFILITHIKRTMQMVDVLYGVTMPQPGVSKMVSVQLSDEASKRLPKTATPAVA